MAWKGSVMKRCRLKSSEHTSISFESSKPVFWVATYQDGAKYAREHHGSTVTSKMAGAAIEVSVSHKLDPKLYDLPLTAKTIVPNDWQVVRFRQGSDLRWLPIHREGGQTFVLYRIAPNGVPATLERGVNGPRSQ